MAGEAGFAALLTFLVDPDLDRSSPSKNTGMAVGALEAFSLVQCAIKGALLSGKLLNSEASPGGTAVAKPENGKRRKRRDEGYKSFHHYFSSLVFIGMREATHQKNCRLPYRPLYNTQSEMCHIILWFS